MLYDILYALYEVSCMLLDVTEKTGLSTLGYRFLFFASIAEKLIVFALLFIFRGIGLYTMAKKRNVKNAYFAFVPFMSFALISKLQANGKYSAKTRWYWIVATVALCVSVMTEIIIDLCLAINPIKIIFSGGILVEENFIVTSIAVEMVSLLSGLSQLVYLVFAIMTYANLFKAYIPARSGKYITYIVFSYLILGSTFLAGILIFAIRNRERVDYDDYVAYVNAKRRYYYGSNPYANPRGGNNPYGGGYQNGNTYGGSVKNDDPFAEFSKKEADDPFADFGNGGSNTGSSGATKDGERKDDYSDDLF